MLAKIDTPKYTHLLDVLSLYAVCIVATSLYIRLAAIIIHWSTDHTHRAQFHRHPKLYPPLFENVAGTQPDPTYISEPLGRKRNNQSEPPSRSVAILLRVQGADYTFGSKLMTTMNRDRMHVRRRYLHVKQTYDVPDKGYEGAVLLLTRQRNLGFHECKRNGYTMRMRFSAKLLNPLRRH